ncbi:MAG: extracellular solute-binding protein [Rhodobacterales bacterium]|nr:extracellular solute-binding protein [Rhodobacterales bacterium]
MLPQDHRTIVLAAARANAQPHRKGWLFGGALVVASAMMTDAARAQDATVITSHGYNFYGQLKYGPDFANLDYVNPDAPKGGEISVWAQGAFDNMNPYAAEGTPGSLSTSGYETMMTGTADEVTSSYCLLCETLEYPEDLSYVIFHMRPEARFSDGIPVTANDVAYSYNLLMEQGLPSYRAAVSQIIAGVSVIDDLTVRFDFVPDAPVRDRIGTAGGSPVWSKTWYETTGARLDEGRLEISPGSGAYILDSLDPGRQIIYRRNPDYWGNNLPINIGQNNFDTIRVEYFADSTAAFEGFKAGEYTFRQENSSLSWATQYDFPALSAGHVVKVTLPNGNLPGANGIVFNLAKPQFADRRVRDAMALVFNFSWTNETLQYSLFSQRESFWQNSDLAAQGVPEGRELELLQSVSDLIDPAILTEPVTMPHTSDAAQQLDRTNLRAALALLEEAGWVAGEDGKVRNADGTTLDVEFLSYSPTFDRIVMPYVDNLTRIGINATYNRIDPAQYQQRKLDLDYDMIIDGYSNRLDEGLGLTQRYGSEGVGDVFNPASFSSPAVDKLIQVVAAATDYEEMAAGVRAIDRIMRREMFIVPTWYNPNFWVAYFDMYEHPDPLPPYALGQLSFWWYNAEKGDALRAAGALR